MTQQTPLSRGVHAALEIDPRVNLHDSQINVIDDNGNIVLEGHVGDIAAKRSAVLVARGVPGVKSVVDSVIVDPSDTMGDGEIRVHARDALLNEPVFRAYKVGVVESGDVHWERVEPSGNRGEVIVSVQDGVVTLEGVVESPSHRRMAGVLAWWVPGSLNVDNRLVVRPERDDTNEEVADAVRLVLEKDPLVNAGQITVRAEGLSVVLAGSVNKESERVVAEHDAWYVDGVREVKNMLEIPKLR